MSNKSSIIIQTIKALRLARGYSQEELADRLSVDLKTYSNWETGKVQMTIEKINRIASALNVDPREIWDDTKWVSKPYKLNDNIVSEESVQYLKPVNTDVEQLQNEIMILKEQNLALTRAYNELFEKKRELSKVTP